MASMAVEAKEVAVAGRPSRVRHRTVERGAPSYAWTVGAVALATLAGLALTAVVPLPNVSMVFLFAVLFAAARFGLWLALLASVLSFLAYNFFFIEPVHTFSVAEPHELLAL